MGCELMSGRGRLLATPVVPLLWAQGCAAVSGLPPGGVMEACGCWLPFLPEVQRSQWGWRGAPDSSISHRGFQIGSSPRRCWELRGRWRVCPDVGPVSPVAAAWISGHSSLLRFHSGLGSWKVLGNTMSELTPKHSFVGDALDVRLRWWCPRTVTQRFPWGFVSSSSLRL